MYNNYDHTKYSKSNKPVVKPRFYIGDWITVRFHGLQKITDIWFNSGLKLDMFSFDNKYNVYVFADAKLWQPMEGEWCWFWDNNSDYIPVLRQFNKMIENKYSAGNSSGIWCKCEPYLAGLPTIVTQNDT